MKHLLIFPLVGLCLLGRGVSAGTIPPEVLRLVPAQYDLTRPELKDAKKELEEIVSLCGPGVVEGANAENRCSYTVRLDELFFTPTWEKTGLLHDPNWPYQDGVTWYEPAEQDGVPDNFDLRDLMLNGQPVIKQQSCGDCWAWSTHHGLEITRAVHDQKAYDHSIQTVLSCSRAGSCSGGYMKAVDFLVHGLPYETDFPYAGYDKSCKYSSSDIATGWDGKIIAAPYVGNSLDYSRARQRKNGTFREGSKVQAMMAAMYQWKSPLVVTVDSYSISGSGVYDSCSSINDGGNHMVAIVGWEMWQGKRVAHVWNSHGQGHGDHGVSRIVWECGDNRLNRGLGMSAKIVQYKAPCTPPDAAQTYLHEIAIGQGTQIGVAQSPNTTCTWAPTEGLADPHSCVTTAKPSTSTEYHLTASNACGTSSSMVMVHVWGKGNRVRTPYGEVAVR